MYAQLAGDVNVDPATLAQIAEQRPDLHLVVVQNPNCYPELLAWLAQSQDPAVSQAATAELFRRTGPPAPPRQPAQPALPTPLTQTAGLKKSKMKTWLLLSGVAAVLVAAVVGVLFWRSSVVQGVAQEPVPSDAWVSGAREVWSIPETPWDIRVTGNYILAYGADETTLYEVSAKGADLKWSVPFPGLDPVSYLAPEIVGDKVLINNQVFKLSDGSHVGSQVGTGLLDGSSRESFGDEILVFDYSSGIKAYNSELQVIWTTYSTPTGYAGEVVEDGGNLFTLVQTPAGGLTRLNVKTGEEFPVSLELGEGIGGFNMARDGWWLADYETDQVVLIAPDGTVRQVPAASYEDWDMVPFAITRGGGVTLNDVEYMASGGTLTPRKDQVTGWADRETCQVQVDGGLSFEATPSYFSEMCWDSAGSYAWGLYPEPQIMLSTSGDTLFLIERTPSLAVDLESGKVTELPMMLSHLLLEPGFLISFEYGRVEVIGYVPAG